FLVYAIRHAALESEDGAFRGRLFTLLLDTRYRLVALLGGDPAVGGGPVRELFLEAWGGLRGILSEAQTSGLLAKSVLRYALFVDAGDALLALEQAAPGLPLSADGLRRLARTLAPAEASDPLAHGWAVDPELARLFGFQPIPEKGSSLPFFVRTAEGERPLDRWVPARSELGEYEKRLGALLRSTAAAEEARAELAAPYDAIYESLVPATALIESCWHQYVARGGKVTYLRSAAGSIGLMQINQHVWRGFYDVNRLRWDTAYNARAGAQILLRYVKDYAIPYAEKAGDPRRVPRAAYAVYNAGPRAAGRFDRPKPHPREARVDEKLWTLFQGLAAGGEADLETCGVRPARAAAAARS
ncbi:MAG: lytic transglycosylase domain-containing protein, partial [Betaproteobacteria bacterium]|nr:lytic transglycosylase domain-containing protein [Betaproteobacteria bacterium]